MQPRNLALAAAVLVAVLLDVLLLLGDEAELWLLPHAATTSVADTASAAAAHALFLTLTSTGPGTTSAWPRIHPGLSRRLCLVVSPGKRTDVDLTGSLPNRNPNMTRFLAGQTYGRDYGRVSSCFPTG
jgi:hypothetical protein